MATQDINAVVASYEATIASLARPLVGRNGAELDDLMQEGRIDVWQSHCRGVQPAAHIIQGRLLAYVKWLGRQSPVDYGTALPMDDYRGLHAVDVYAAARDE